MTNYFDIGYMIRSFPTILGAVHVTVFITVVSAFLGILLGAAIAVARVKKVRILNPILVVYISFIRGTPFLVQLFLIYFGVPEIMNHLGFSTRGIPGLLFVLIVFTLHIAAYGAEILRSSIEAVATGEKEAAESLGMTEWQSYTRVILPQAFALAVPPLVNTVISVLKGTALIFNVGIVDMMRRADLMGGNSQRYLELFVDVAIIYGILVFLITQIGRFIERHYDRSGEAAEKEAA